MKRIFDKLTPHCTRAVVYLARKRLFGAIVTYRRYRCEHLDGEHASP